MDNKSHIFKHLHSTTTCPDLHNSLSFEIIDKASSKLNLKIKEALHINWRKPNLNAQQNHLALTLHPFTIACVTPFFFSVFVLLFFFVFFFLISFSSIIFIVSETPIISHFLLSYLHVAITSSHYNTPCVTPFSSIYYFHCLCGTYQHFLQS